MFIDMQGRFGILFPGLEGSGTAMPQEQDEVLTVREVADYLKVTAKTVYTLVNDGELQSFRIGRAVRCKRADVESFINSRQNGKTPTKHRAKGRS